MAKPEDGSSKLALEGHAEHDETGEASDRELYLDEGRTLKVSRAAGEQVVEVRAASGQLELRVRLTDQGPVLQMEAVKLALTAEESVAIKCKTFEVEASGDTVIQSGGELKIKSDGEMEVESPEDVRIRGKIIWLN
jgi:hypothetical protein